MLFAIVEGNSRPAVMHVLRHRARAAALVLLACPSTDLALNCYANRAACFQQMREPQLALADTERVLAFDPSNAKALARKQVYEQQLAGM